MRKTFLNEFNSISKFNSTKRHKSDDYILLCLQKYVRKLFAEISCDKNESEQAVLFLGSLFYPKTMMKLYGSAKEQRQIERVHSMHAKFSAKNMDICFQENPIARKLLEIFVDKNQEKLLENNDTMNRAKSDYEWGFRYLLSLYCQAWDKVLAGS